MKKRIISTLFCLCIGFCAVACSSDDSDLVTKLVTEPYEETADVTQDTNGESVSVATEMPENEATSTAPSGETVAVTDDGVYDATLMANDKDNAGAADENGQVRCITYNTSLTDDAFYLEGVYGYHTAEGQDTTSTSENGIYSFKIDDNTQFSMGASGGTDSIPKDIFRKNLASCANSGIKLAVTVQGGVATKIEICA